MISYSLSDNSVSIAGVTCDVNSENSTLVVCTTRSSVSSGHHKVILGVKGSGNAIGIETEFEYIDRWSSLWTWGGKPLPVEGDVVVIEEGQTVLLDVDTPILNMLLIQGNYVTVQLEI